MGETGRPSDALERALRVFWRTGYEKSSLMSRRQNCACGGGREPVTVVPRTPRNRQTAARCRGEHLALFRCIRIVRRHHTVSAELSEANLRARCSFAIEACLHVAKEIETRGRHATLGPRSGECPSAAARNLAHKARFRARSRSVFSRPMDCLDPRGAAACSEPAARWNAA
jgi:hypothetical protein